ncbi:response regulator [candidate division KSB1 bacterium]
MTNKSDSEERLNQLKQERDFFKKSIDDVNLQFQEKIHELSLIRKIGDQLQISITIEEACINIVAIVLDEINAESCSLLMLDKNTDEIVLKSVKTRVEEKAKFFEEGSTNARRFKLGEGIAGKAAKQQITIRIDDTTLESEFIPNFISKSNIKSIICVPLISREQTLGVLNLSSNKKNAFSVKDERILNILTNQISSSLSNLFYSRELISINSELKSALDELKDAQEKLNEHSKNLEKLVEDKTKEISYKNIELKKQYDKISEIDRIKSEYYSLISQELVTPLNSILTFSNILLEQGYGKLNLKQFKYLQNIYNSSNLIIDKVGMLTEMTRVDAGQSELLQENVNINIVVNEFLDSFSSNFNKKNINPVSKFDNSLATVKVDTKKINYILKNLFLNLIKYAPEESSVKIETKNILTENLYSIFISININKKIKESIKTGKKEIFSLTEQLTEIKENIGRNIDLSKRLLELMDGKIDLTVWRKSDIRILISLPGSGVLETNNIMIAEDDTEVLDFLKALLESENYKIQTAANGVELLNLLEDNIPDLIITDMIMPKTDGYKLIETIKTNPRTKEIPMVIISGQIKLEIDRLYKLGIDEFISKPFSNTLLLSVVRRLILNRKYSRL